jgi:hypothetical protein
VSRGYGLGSRHDFGSLADFDLLNPGVRRPRVLVSVTPVEMSTSMAGHMVSIELQGLIQAGEEDRWKGASLKYGISRCLWIRPNCALPKPDNVPAEILGDCSRPSIALFVALHLLFP